MGIQIIQVQTELGAFLRTVNNEIQAMFYGPVSPLVADMRTLTAVKGKFPAFHSHSDNIIQGFTSTWNAMGTTIFRVNELIAYHLKGNVAIVPSDIEGSWLGWMNEEDAALADKSISRYIMERELIPKVTEDVADLMVNGDYDALDLGTFGKSMNGISKIIDTGVVDVANPMVRVPLTTLTDNNIVAEVTNFEKWMGINANKAGKQVTSIYMSKKNANRYRTKYEDTYGANTLITEDKMMVTRLNGWLIKPVDEIKDDLIFVTIGDNMLRLIDTFDAPAVTDLQVLDYTLKIFMEAHLGVGFWINHLVFVADYAGEEKFVSGAEVDFDTLFPQNA